jgi:transketolase
MELGMPTPAALHAKAAELGKLSLRMTAKAAAGHPSSALSLAHLVAHLMYTQMRYDPRDPYRSGADRLVLSEGHAVPIIYAAYADLGGAVGCSPGGCDCAGQLTVADLDQLRARESVLDGHPNPGEGFPFFDAATGSLGQGLSVAAGLALAARLDGSDRRIYAIVGDGESREGQIWEAADFIAERNLSNVCAIFNANGHGQAGPVSSQQSAERLAAKLAAFGWDVTTIDGHDPAAITAALARFEQSSKPLAIVARTVKGWGVDLLLKGNWHGKPPEEKDLPAAYASLDRTAAALGASAGNLGPPPAPPAVRPAADRPAPPEVRWPSFTDAMTAAGLGKALEKGQLSTRKAYGAALKVAGDLLPQVVCLDGDVSNSTFAEIFAAAHPTRFFECKIAEQNMISAAVGLAAGGCIPFANTFAKFVARAYDQIELANISRANIKIVGSHSGVTPCSDGPSQMGLLDVAFFRAFTTVRGDDRSSPLCWFYQPADAIAAYHCTRLMTMHRGMAYMRTHRPDVPFLYDAATATFEPGGFGVLSTGDDVALVASGYMVHVARKASELLARQNVRAAVIDAYSLPIRADRLIETFQRSGRRALVVEDNYGASLGSAVADLAAAAGGVRVEQLFCQRIPKSTRLPEEELDYCGVNAPQIADHARALLRR